MAVLNLFHSCVCSFTAGTKSLCKLSERSVGTHTYFLDVKCLQFLMIPSCPLIATSQFHCPCMCFSLSNAWIITLAREISSTITLFWITTGKSWMNRLLFVPVTINESGAKGYHLQLGSNSPESPLCYQLSWTTLSINWLHLDPLRRC